MALPAGGGAATSLGSLTGTGHAVYHMRSFWAVDARTARASSPVQHDERGHNT